MPLSVCYLLLRRVNSFESFYLFISCLMVSPSPVNKVPHTATKVSESGMRRFFAAGLHFSPFFFSIILLFFLLSLFFYDQNDNPFVITHNHFLSPINFSIQQVDNIVPQIIYSFLKSFWEPPLLLFSVPLLIVCEGSVPFPLFFFCFTILLLSFLFYSNHPFYFFDRFVATFPTTLILPDQVKSLDLSSYDERLTVPLSP